MDKNVDNIDQKNTNFSFVYNKAHRLAAAVFMVCNLMDENGEFGTKIKNVSLELIFVSVNMKDTNVLETKKTLSDIEKICLKLMSMLDIAYISNLISKMNADILKDEFRMFISELNKFAENFNKDGYVSMRKIFDDSIVLDLKDHFETSIFNGQNHIGAISKIETKKQVETENQNGGKQKRKDLRKNTVLEFIKGHNHVSIKDIVPNINGCSEKTIQRELITLINEGKVKKTGERRWSKYSII